MTQIQTERSSSIVKSPSESASKTVSGAKIPLATDKSPTQASELASGTALVPSVVPDLFLSLSYREFLGQWFAAKKKFQSGYSGALFAKKAGIGSHTLLGMVIRGDRNLSPATTRAFIRAMGLKGREAIYFEKLVLFNQSKNSEDRSYYFEQLCSVSNGQGRELITKIKNHASYLSHWYIAAIRELVGIEGFSADPEWIAKKLKRKITARQAQDAWGLLLSLGMVEQKGDTYQIVSPAIDIDPGYVDFAIRNFHKEYLARAKDAIDGEPFEERELSSITLSLSEEDLGLLRERIKEFRKKLNTEFPVDKSPRKKVVAVNMQALILTD